MKCHSKVKVSDSLLAAKLGMVEVSEIDTHDERAAHMMNVKSGSIEGFEQFSQFESLKEFNHHMEMWLLEHKTAFSKGEQVGLKRLVRFSAKIPGICNAKIGTILKAIHKEYHDHGISRSTFKRMISKAKQLGIFTVYETERKNGSQSSNLYVFHRFPTNEPPKQETMNHLKETTNLFKTEKDQKIKKRKQEPFKLDHTFVSSRVPVRFVQFVKCFFSDAMMIEEYWRMVQILAFDYQLDKETDVIVDLAIDSFRQLIRKLKFTKVVRKPIAYFYGILKEKLYQYYNNLFDEKREAGLVTYQPYRHHVNGEIIEWDWLHGVDQGDGSHGSPHHFDTLFTHMGD
ncbi:hypothetical protein [Neobacillus jeddahensis]|uniref:hypothetical protein n=1 Tax=Neobacillus jeddahensis TaxID=1461580 RepID=UPI000A4197AD|nr:hypothetical protein [Neobacillus jeddahensis]